MGKMVCGLTAALFDVNATRAGELLRRCAYPWQALPELAKYISAWGGMLSAQGFEERAPGVWIHRSARVAGTAQIDAPAIIDEGAEIRHAALIRGAVLIGRGCVVGNSTELKNCVLMDGAQAPHFNYVGDSILGRGAHMGAGAIASNLRADGCAVRVSMGGAHMDTGLRKLGAMIGDHAEIGCGAVLCPGAVLGRGARVYPLSMVRGLIPERHLLKRDGSIVALRDMSDGGPQPL